MPDHSDAGSRPGTDDRRSQAITAFLGAGMHDLPTPALAVRALADARRSVGAFCTRGEPIDRWLAEQVRFPGITENAATLAALEVPEHRQQIAHSYASRHPDRLAVLQELMAVI